MGQHAALIPRTRQAAKKLEHLHHPTKLGKVKCDQTSADGGRVPLHLVGLVVGRQVPHQVWRSAWRDGRRGGRLGEKLVDTERLVDNG